MQAFQDNPPSKSFIPLSFGVEKVILSNLLTKDEITDQAVYNSVVAGAACVHKGSCSKEDLDALSLRVAKRLTEFSQPKDKAQQIRFGKSLGTGYSDWLASLDSEQLCLYLADNNPEQAYRYYWHVDFEWVTEAVKLKAEHDSQILVGQMEAALYGFGGKYKDDDGEAAHHDLLSQDGAEALRQFGF